MSCPIRPGGCGGKVAAQSEAVPKSNQPYNAGYPASQRQLGQGYAFDDYEFSSDDESSDPAAAAAAPALAAPLHRWRGPLEFWDTADEGAYIDWACSAWQVCGLLPKSARLPRFDEGWVRAASCSAGQRS